MRTDLDALSIVITNWLTFGSNIFNVTILCRKKKEELKRQFLDAFYLQIRKVAQPGYKQDSPTHKLHHCVI